MPDPISIADGQCPICHQLVSRTPGPGRPAVYDSRRCRRIAERRRTRDLARIGRAVERALAANSKGR